MTHANPLSAFVLSLLLLIGAGCDATEAPAPPIFASDALSKVTYNFVGINQDDSVVLLGELSFSDRQEDVLSGSWELAPWGEQEHFASLPGSGSFTGFIHGETAIIQISLSDGSESLGLIVEGFQEDRLVGSFSLLPSFQFKGRFEAIEQHR